MLKINLNEYQYLTMEFVWVNISKRYCIYTVNALPHAYFLIELFVLDSSYYVFHIPCLYSRPSHWKISKKFNFLLNFHHLGLGKAIHVFENWFLQKPQDYEIPSWIIHQMIGNIIRKIILNELTRSNAICLSYSKNNESKMHSPSTIPQFIFNWTWRSRLILLAFLYALFIN